MSHQISYQLYNKPESSVFDLIKGDREVQQTKGLALLLAKDAKFLQAFLKLPQIHGFFDGKSFTNDCARIVVHSEMTAANDANEDRIDICICFYRNGHSDDRCVIIEAKSANKQSSNSVFSQLDRYVESSDFLALEGFKRCGLVLTKNRVVSNNLQYQSLMWDDVVRLLVKLNPTHGELAYDFFNFLTNIHGAMKFYEKEVFSIPAGRSSDHLAQYPFIYECPNSGVYQMKKKPLYLTFRKSGGGEMDKLYGLDEVIVFNPKQDLKSFLSSPAYDRDVKERIESYCSNSWNGNPPNEEKQFFVLSKTNQIHLKHLPKPLTNNAFRVYYRLADLLDETQKVVHKEEKL